MRKKKPTIEIPVSERPALADLVGCKPEFLQQCLMRHRDMGAADAVKLEQLSKRRICRWHVRSDWAEIWPEVAKRRPAKTAASPALAAVEGL